MYFILKNADFSTANLGKITVVEGSVGTGGTTIDPNAEYTFTINPTPTSATVTLSATDYSTVSGIGIKSITVAPGTVVSWSVSASGYISQNGTQNVTDTISKNVELITNSSSEGETGAEN